MQGTSGVGESAAADRRDSTGEKGESSRSLAVADCSAAGMLARARNLFLHVPRSFKVSSGFVAPVVLWHAHAVEAACESGGPPKASEQLHLTHVAAVSFDCENALHVTSIDFSSMFINTVLYPGFL